MRQRLMLRTALLAVATGAVVAGLSATAQENEPTPIERVAAAEDPVPVDEPPDGSLALVVVYQLAFEEGILQNAEVVSAEEIPSFSPKVGVVEGGEWQVTTEGVGSITFFTWDPGWQEAEGDPEGDSEFEWIPVTGSIEWVLVVPLSDDRERIEVERIIIVDTRTGEVVIETEV